MNSIPASSSRQSGRVIGLLRRTSISWRFGLLLVLFALFVGSVIVQFSLGVSKALDFDIQAAQEVMLQGQKEKLKVATDSMALAIGQAIKNEPDHARRVEIIRDMVDPIRFEEDKSGYYFVYEKTVNVALPTLKERHGKDLADIKDKNGVYYVRDLATIAQRGGFIEYVFPKPGQGDQPKLAYATMIPGTNFWIGTGIYIDNVEKEKGRIRETSAAHIDSALKAIYTNVGASLAVLGLLCWLIIKSVTGPIGEATSAAIRCSQGDLDIALDASGKDEAARMQAALNAMVATLRQNIQDIETKTAEADQKALAAQESMRLAEEANRKAEQARCDGMAHAARSLAAIVDHIGESTQSISTQANGISHRAGEQQGRIGETTSAMDQMVEAVTDVAKNAAQASSQAQQATALAQEGRSVVTKSIEAMRQLDQQARGLKGNMDDLGKRSQDIDRILTVISDIADQTNLLALNAAIEAARAGDAGRGFAVVADEVRKLAEKTMSATREVSSSITAIQHSARESIAGTDKALETIILAGELADRSGSTLDELVNGAQNSALRIQEIATAAEQQSSTAESINGSLEDLNVLTSETARAVGASTQSIGALLEDASRLREVVEGLKVEAGCGQEALGKGRASSV